jgi:ribosomal protein L12E/L44/L45/RPP1/RPP2
MANIEFTFKLTALDEDSIERRVHNLEQLIDITQRHVDKYNDPLHKKTLKELKAVLASGDKKPAAAPAKPATKKEASKTSKNTKKTTSKKGK